MTAAIGDRIPELTLRTRGPDGLEDQPLAAVFAGNKVVMFSVPGAFTPTCSKRHLPGFVAKAEELAGQGVDVIACLSVNDPHVMYAWQQAHNAQAIVMLADGNGELTRALGLTRDFSASGMSVRGKRFAMIVEDWVITHIAVDDSGLQDSSAEACLTVL
jgi:peroxiredoxin